MLLFDDDGVAKPGLPRRGNDPAKVPEAHLDKLLLVLLHVGRRPAHDDGKILTGSVITLKEQALIKEPLPLSV